MYTQKIFQAGNSSVVAIPKELLRRLDLKTGSLVTITPSLDDSHFVVKKPTVTKPIQKSASQKAHLEWLNVFLEENSEILDELAKH